MVTGEEHVAVFDWARRAIRNSPRGIPFWRVDAEFGPGTCAEAVSAGALVWRDPRRPTRVRLGVRPVSDRGTVGGEQSSEQGLFEFDGR